MSHKSIAGVVAALALVVGAGVSRASFTDTVYDNGALDPAGTFLFSDVSFQVADDFVLAPGDNTFDCVSWEASYFDPPPVTDSLAMIIYGDDGGLPDPGNQLHFVSLTSLTRTDTGDVVPGLGRPIFEFDATFGRDHAAGEPDVLARARQHDGAAASVGREPVADRQRVRQPQRGDRRVVHLGQRRGRELPPVDPGRPGRWR